jgi:sugar transferase (PEP-CTERM/EpsH1 system associated)
MSPDLKKIVHVTFDMRIGGAEQVIYNIVENTDPSKYEVSILCLDQPVGPFGRQLQEKGCKVAALKRKPGFDLSLVTQIRHYITRNNVDVLHCHQYTPYVYGVLGAAFTRTKVIFTEHGRFYPDQLKLKRVSVNPLLNLLTDSVTAISSATREALVKFENFPNNKIRIVYNGIDGSRYRCAEDSNLKKSLGVNKDAKVIGTVARLDSIKNQKIMIKALKIVQQTYPKTFLIMVGDGPEREPLEALTSDLGLSSHVLFTGFREDAHLFYKTMDIFLLTSFSEGTAMTLLEAMASSLPCIATDVGGNPEIVRDGETGFIIPSNDEITLAETICTLFGNEELMKKIGNTGRERFEEQFTVEKMVRAYEDMYDGKL